MIYSTQNTALQTDQAIAAAYSGLVLAGTGLVRLAGSQNISGNKTFHNQLNVSGDANFSGDVSLTKIAQALPTSDSTVDLGSTSLKFRTGFFSGVSGFTGHFNNLKVDLLSVDNLTLDLNSKTGNNFTFSGTTNLNNIVASGNCSVSGNLNITGTTNINSTNIYGAIYATGTKSFSGSLFQSGNLNITGDVIFRGNTRTTGNVFVTGNQTVIGTLFTTGGINHSGGVSIKAYTDNFSFKALNTAIFDIDAPVSITGQTSIDGNLNIAQNRSVTLGNNTSFSMVGAFSNNGTITNTDSISGSAILSTGVVSGKIITNGNSSIPALKLNDNLSDVPQLGSIEFSRNSFLFSRKLQSSSYRHSLNPIYHYFMNNERVFNFMTGGPNGIPYRFLGTTGILLDTGVYRIESSFYFRKGTTQPTIQFGFSGDNCNFTYINGYIGRILNSTDIVKNFINTNTATSAFSGLWTGTTTTNRSGIADVTIVVTGANHKIYPFLYSATANATGSMTGSFSMTVTQLQTGTGNISFNGPWIA